PDLLTEAIGVEELKGTDCDLIQTLEQSQLAQLLDGVRQCVDAYAKFADRVRLLEYFTIEAAGMQHKRCGKPADAAADNDCLHALRSNAPIQPSRTYHGRRRTPCARAFISYGNRGPVAASGRTGSVATGAAGFALAACTAPIDNTRSSLSDSSSRRVASTVANALVPSISRSRCRSTVTM